MPVTVSLSRAFVVALLGNDPMDFNGGIGTIILAQRSVGYSNILTAGNTYSGSSFIPVPFSEASSGTNIPILASATPGTLPGTWRALTSAPYTVGNFSCAIIQRIA